MYYIVYIYNYTAAVAFGLRHQFIITTARVYPTVSSCAGPYLCIGRYVQQYNNIIQYNAAHKLIGNLTKPMYRVPCRV